MAEINPSGSNSYTKATNIGMSLETSLEETGVILEIGDGIARVYGLTNARAEKW